MPQAVANKALNEGLLDLDDQWSNSLQVVNQLDEVPTGPHNPSVVLCTLEGILSDYSESTRNARWYSGELWDIVLNSENFKELERTRTLFGESDHPMDIEDRYDVHYNYVSHCVRDVVHDRANQCVRGKLDILDTPAGRIIFTFVKYGSILGVSSRGAGDLIERNGRIEVDPLTYQFYAWDIVHRPSNRKARVAITESLKPNNRLTTLIESAKSDRNSLNWIKSLVESTEVPDKSQLLNKVNEYIEMFTQDENSGLPAEEQKAYEDKIQMLQSDIIDLTNQIVVLQQKLSDASTIAPQSSSPTIDTTRLEEMLNKFNTLQTKLEESIMTTQKNQDNSNKSEIRDVIDSVKEEVLDRIDEAYENLIKPVYTTKKTTDSMGELIKANGDFVVGSVSKLIPAQVVVDQDDVIRLESELSQAESELKNSQKENRTLNERITRLLESRNVETRKYLSTRCSQLGLNESLVARKLGNITDYSFDEIDEELSELYMESPELKKPSVQLKSPAQLNGPLGHGEIVKRKSLKESVNDAVAGNLDIISLIRDNN